MKYLLAILFGLTLLGCGVSIYSLSERRPEESSGGLWPPPLVHDADGGVCPGSLPHGRHR